MPHIHAYFRKSKKLKELALPQHKRAICFAVARCFGYNGKEVALIAHIMSKDEALYSENILPLQLVIDIGAQDKDVTDEHSSELLKQVLTACPFLRSFNFGVWVRSMNSNGYSEHTPL